MTREATFSLFLILLLMVGAVAAASPEKQKKEQTTTVEDLRLAEGIYTIEGDTGEKKYSGVAALKLVGPGVRIQYLTGGYVAAVGLRKGDMLSMSWRTQEGQGITIYKVGKKTLTGHWFHLPGDGSLGKETLTWIAPLPAVEEDE